jgi:hypothetical protein
VPDSAIALLKRVSDFLRGLSDEDIQALETGEAKLAVVRKAAPRTAQPVELSLDPDRVNADLKTIDDRATAARYLQDLKLKRPQLVELARRLEVPFGSKDSMATIVARIVEQKVGSRLTGEAFR